MITSFKSQSLSFSQNKSYLIATVFIIFNLLLPQIFHAFNLGGEKFLPMLFFTIVAAGSFGVSAALMTAVFSPIISMLIFGMPSVEMMTVLMVKGVTVALVLGFLAQKYRAVSMVDILLAIVAYQLVGLIVATFIFNFDMAVGSMLVSYPAVLVQIVFGTLAIKYISKRQF